MPDPQEVSRIKGVKEPLQGMQTTTVTAETEFDDEPIEKVDEEAVPTSVPEVWKQFSALKKRVERIENNWFLRWFL